MRTIDQIQKDLLAAREEAQTANAKVKKLEEEAREIYMAVKNLLQIKDTPFLR